METATGQVAAMATVMAAAMATTDSDGSYQYVFNVNGGTSNAKTCTYNTQTKYTDQQISTQALACLSS
ncbi:hypothetical protein NQ176_g6333 [Zarea fungicola]|uniref:Uncharacterized protein n=1 Tax=Zarea fungicola TaxID=93591 RepID=A0ACC1N4R0_9HYPO|nr:hypothetical protein NQ176_g6333 [Lecanicillium fungicola]